jgi:predicted metal-dependent hydrolase
MSACDLNDPRIEEGICLFNAGEYFACHDVLEDFWGELTCPEKPFFQGLIQAAVALFHFEEGNLGGARRMSISSRAYMHPFAPSLGGIDVERLLNDMDACFAELCQPHESYPAHLQLQPSLIPRIFREWIPEGRP